MKKEEIQFVRSQLYEGKTPRQIAKEYGLNRVEIQKIGKEPIFKIKMNLSGFFGKVFFVIVLSLLFIWIGYRLIKEPSQEETGQKLRVLAEVIHAKSVPDRWHFEKLPSAINFAEEISFVTSRLQILENSLEKHKRIPGVDILYKMFAGKLYPTIFISERGRTYSRQVVRTEEMNQRVGQIKKGAQEIVFYGRGDLNHPKIGDRTLFYDRNWRALFLPSLEGSDLWKEALFLHELWHAKSHRDGSIGAIAPENSDPWVDEEVEAHLIEQTVLNNGIDDRYRQALSELVRKDNGSSLQKFLHSVKAEDILGIDALFERPMVREVGLRAAQYYFDLSTTWISFYKKEGDMKKERREAYRLLRRIS